MSRISHLAKHHAKKGWRHVTRHAKDHFVPHKGNGFHPHVLKHHVLLGYGVFFLLVKILGVTATVVSLPSDSLFASAITAQNIIALTNEARTKSSLPQLTANDLLMRAAQAKAEDMATRQYFAHTSPGGLSPWYWIKKVGYKYRYAGENLAVHYTDAEGVQQGWLASPAHRDNILSLKYSNIGIGISMGSFEGANSIFVVQMFGQPQTTTIASLAPPSAPTTTTIAVQPTRADRPTPSAQRVTTTTAPDTSVLGARAETVPPPSPSSTIPAPLEDASIVIRQNTSTYSIQIPVPHAKEVTALLSAHASPLTPESTNNLWKGTIPYTQQDVKDGGEPLMLRIKEKDGTEYSRLVAWLMPGSRLDQLYAFRLPSDSEKPILGSLGTEAITTYSRWLYAGFIAFLMISLSIHIFAEIRRQKASVIIHTVAVIGLAFMLLVL